MRRVLPCIAAIFTGSCLMATGAMAQDWPQWRFDARRSAASPHELPAKLRLLWQRRYTARVPAWENPLNRDKMTFDRHFEPVVKDGRMFVTFNDADKVVALDSTNGKRLWQFYADGPIRLPACAWKDRVFVISDDAHLYCLDAATGKLRWRFFGAPQTHKALGHGRVISMWPARGGAAVHDDKVFFACSVWPFLGTFVYAIHAETGEPAWINDQTGPYYSLQPHGSAAFGGVAPQGSLVIADDCLLVPGGRSLPAAFDARNGAFRYFFNSGIVGGKGVGGSFVAASDTHYVVHSRRRGVQKFDLATGKNAKMGFHGEPVLDGEHWYVPGGKTTGAMQSIVESIGPSEWKIDVDASGDLIKAGNRLYAAGKSQIAAIQLNGERPATKAWSIAAPEGIVRLLAADEKLFAVTLDGRILAFGKSEQELQTWAMESKELRSTAKAVVRVHSIVDATQVSAGYAICFGVSDGDLLAAMLQATDLHVVAVHPDAAVVDRLRRRFDAAGVYGKRIAVHPGDPRSFNAPSNIAGLVLVGDNFAGEYTKGAALKEIFRAVRPYGGALWIDSTGQEIGPRLESIARDKSDVHRYPSGWKLSRPGPLPGAADWTHQYGDVGNTGKSNDRVVKLPLGVLWFGGPSNEQTQMRSVTPPEQVVAGRLFVLGADSMTARDVYTGRTLWTARFRPKDLKRLGIDGDESGSEPDFKVPADPYGAHKPGDIQQANTRGTNFVATEKLVYVARGNVCRVVDAETGRTTGAFQLPRLEGRAKPPAWGYIGVLDNVLLGGWSYADFSKRLDPKSASATVIDRYASGGLVAFDRKTGRRLWQVKANHSFLHNAIVAGNGRVYCLDRLPAQIEKQLKRRGVASPESYRIVALDLRTGRKLWEEKQGIFGSWLNYSRKHDVLLQAIDHGPAGIDRRNAGRGLAAYRGKDGKALWSNRDVAYFGPCILLDETILTNGRFYGTSTGAFNLLVGSDVLIRNPLTGVEQPWRISRGYGCNSMRASEHLLTYRSGCAAYYDLTSKSGTGSLGGFRSGCTSNLIIANGVLNAPDMTRHCTCNFQQQTSLALVHVPDLKMERWTCHYGPLNPLDFLAYQPIPLTQPVRRVGINLNAPGDRQAENGTLWTDFPHVGGASYSIPIELKGKGVFGLRRHEAFVSGALPWVAASCQINVRDVIVNLNVSKGKPRTYTVRLYFAELGYAKVGQRVFDIALQGKTLIERFDVHAAAGGLNRGIVREFRDVSVSDRLRIRLTPHKGSRGAMLSGVEIVSEVGHRKKQ
jgi:outer membrane protein assembly factor BamB